MADKFLNNTGLSYYHSRIKTLFASQADLDTLEGRVDDIVAEGGEPNVIETVKVNGTALVPSNKAVDVTVPTATSDLTNDGDGQSAFATETYVAENGGKIDVIQVNSSALPISNKTVNIDLSGYALTSSLPTKTSDLTNDSDYQNATQVQALIDSELEGITGIEFEVVQTLPSTGVKGTIYLLQNETSATDVYDEYIWVTTTGGTAHWEQIGTTAVDLSGYWAKADLVAITTAEIDTILAS